MDANTILQFAAILAPYILNQLSKRINAQHQDSSKVSEAIERHLIEVANWVSTVQFFGMGTPKFTEQTTIALDFYTEPRRFQSATDTNTTKNETDLLSDPSHSLMLGEPGSGKTTTFKRIALTMLKKEPIDEGDILQFPMVIRLREMLEGESLSNKISDVFGLVAEPREIITRFTERDTKGRLIEVERKHTEMRIGGDKVEDVVPKFLNEARVMLLLDGLDELRPAYRSKIRDEIVSLGRRLTTSKIIVSCRSGDYTQQMDGFTVLEICPLSKSQILTIKDKWLGVDDKDFMERLRDLPYYDVADRPLLLTQMLFIYKRFGYLPEQPSQIYAKLINLLLEEWDAERGIHRVTQYAGFDPRKKAEFLASLAYQLTYTLQKTWFAEKDLVSAYLSVCQRFRLPKDEATQVAREIQTHTGIIVVGPADIYEFCHLSLQEYLCAEYIVRAPLDTHSIEYLAKNPAPLAIAVALSSHPSNWFGTLILNFRNLNKFDAGNMASFLSRILVECPSFERSEPLGFAMLLLFKHYKNNSTVCQYSERMLEINSVLESVAGVLRWYTQKRQSSISPNFINLSLNKQLEKVYRFELPLEGSFPKSLLPRLKHLNNEQLFE